MSQQKNEQATQNQLAIFSKNLKYLLGKSKLKQNALAEQLGVSTASVCGWVNGKKYPRPGYIVQIAEILNVSVSALREEAAADEPVFPVTYQILAENLAYYMDKHSLNRHDLANIAGVSYGAVTDWIKGRKYPRIDKIERMANYFGVSKSYLIEAHSAPTNAEKKTYLACRLEKVMSEQDDFHRNLLLAILSLSDKQQRAILNVAEAMNG